MPRLTASSPFSLLAVGGGGGGLTMSLDGGLEEVEEFFFNRAFSALNRVTSASISAILANSGATAASINCRTSSSVNSFVMPLS
jgi:hypothetical protein